ncbi:MAG: aspartyl/asparaginyl beta-hydroxylase domain-containing protein [Chitinophagales bacterium]|nr:aspartyl/asparaginyl beta-hydroxylase domain-containing protein [Chitinophagales bacterium]
MYTEAQEYKWDEQEKLEFVRPPEEKYFGRLPNFYKPEIFPELKVLKDNWKAIRDEVLAYEAKMGVLKDMDSHTPPTNTENQWSHTYLMSYLRIFHKNRKKFPFLSSIIDQIPNCTYATISILPPNTEILPHYGDTNGVVRTHLGLVIPAPYPEIAIKVGEEERGWEEGELMCFTIVNKHQVWNRSSKRRYIVILDFIPDLLKDRKMEIVTKTLGSQSFTFLYDKFAIVRYLPNFSYPILCALFTIIWRFYLPIQRRFEFL